LSKGRRRYSIPVAGALQMPDVPVENSGNDGFAKIALPQLPVTRELKR